jgi:hypothetical protein
MITSVSTWLCKCGVRVKVIGQTPKGKMSATQTAACPNCGDKQIVYGDTIIAISREQDTAVQESTTSMRDPSKGV